MSRLLVLGVIAVLALSTPAVADIITVDCNGGADFTDLRLAILSAGAEDTVLVSPCTYFVDPGLPPWYTLWPIELDDESPTIMSTGGAEVTILEGDRSIPAFYVPADSGVANTQMSGLTFRNLTTPIDRQSLYPTGRMVFVDNIVESCDEGLHANSVSSTSIVARNIIRDNDGLGMYIYHNSGLIEDNEICRNGNGIRGACCEEPTITGNHIHHNVGYGIATGFYGDISGNTIEDNGGSGIVMFGSAGGSITDNVIRNNGIGIWIGGVLFECTGNDLYGNLTYDLECSTYIGGGTLDATMNWWGTTDPEEIASHILDCNDGAGIGACIEFEPWCAAPGCDPVAVQPITWGALKSLYR